ncbi:MAG TPA: response regulator [Abditibacteriaceae bacterium]|jgi:CheY-like chemotaxis protein
MRILFVDDVRDTRDMFRLAFGIQGHQTHLASNGVEAVEAIRKESYDALVIDVEMPEMNGWDAVQKIRTLDNGEQLPIILFTAYSGKEDRQRAQQAGADMLLCKPILPQEILAQIKKLIEQRSAGTPRAGSGAAA